DRGIEYTSLATMFLDEPFTVADLRRIYESVWGVELHPANFRRKVLATPGSSPRPGTRDRPGEGGPSCTYGGDHAAASRDPASPVTAGHCGAVRADVPLLTLLWVSRLSESSLTEAATDLSDRPC